MKRYIAVLLTIVMLCMCTVAYADVTVQNDRISAYMDSNGGVILTGYNERINATDAYDLICIDAGRISYMVENEDGTMDILHADFATSTERVLVEDVALACGYDGIGIYYVPANETGSVYYITFSGTKTMVYSSEEEVKYLQRSHHGLIIGFAEQAGAVLYDDEFSMITPFNGLIGLERRIMSDSADLVLTSGGSLYIDDSTVSFPSMIASGVKQFECIDGFIYYIVETETDRSLIQYSPATLSWQEVVLPEGKNVVSITTSYTQMLVMDDFGIVYTINNANCTVSPFANITVPDGIEIENLFIEGVSGQLNVYSEEHEQEAFVLAFNFTMSDSSNIVDDEEDEKRGKITLLATCKLESEMTTFDVLAPAALYETLSYGSRGDTVTDLQRRLVELGYLNDSIDGIYGPLTRYAVMLFQDFNSLEVTGIADKATQELLFDNKKQLVYDPYRQISYGARGLRVTEMQERLRYLGYMADPADGIYGPYTRAGVKLFQQENGINPTGVADARTLSKLYDVTAPKCSSYFEMNYGDSGWRVEKLNKRLKTLYFLEGSAGSYYGSDTRAAVKRFQRDNGLNQTGVASAYMQELLFSNRANEYSGYITLRRGDESNRVYQLQKRLKQLGYYDGNCTGYFGKYTYSCLKDFQSVAGLDITGIADVETQELLFSRYAPEKPEIADISVPYINVDGYDQEIDENTYLVINDYVDIEWNVEGDVDTYFYEIENSRGVLLASGYTDKNGIVLNISSLNKGSTYKVTVYAIPVNGNIHYAKSSSVYIVTPETVVDDPEPTPVPTPEPLVTIEPTPVPEVTAEPVTEVEAPVISVSGDYTLEGNAHIIGDGGAIFSWTEVENTAYNVVITDEEGNIVYDPGQVEGGSVEVNSSSLLADKLYYLVVTAYHDDMTPADGKSVRVVLKAAEPQPDPTEEATAPVIELIVSVTGADKVSDIWQIGDEPAVVSWQATGEVLDYAIELFDPDDGSVLNGIQNTTQTSYQIESGMVVAEKAYGLRITANAEESTVDYTIYVIKKPAPVEETAQTTESEDTSETEEDPVTEEPEDTETEEENNEEYAADTITEDDILVEVNVDDTVVIDGVHMIAVDSPAVITWSNTGDATEYSLFMTDEYGMLLQQVDHTPYTYMTLDGKGMDEGRVYSIRFVAHTSIGDYETTVAFGRIVDEDDDNSGEVDVNAVTEDAEPTDEQVTEFSEPIIVSDTPAYDGVYNVGEEGFSLGWYVEGEISGYDLNLYDGENNLIQNSNGVEYEELFFAYEDLSEGEIYSLAITAVPSNGDASIVKTVIVYFTRAAAEEPVDDEASAEDEVSGTEEYDDESDDDAAVVYTVSEPSLSIAGNGAYDDAGMYVIETGGASFEWHADGDVAYYNVQLIDADGNIINSAAGIGDEYLNLSEDSIADDVVYSLMVTAVPVNGTDESGKSAQVSFMRKAPHVVYSVDAPVINVEGYTSLSDYGEYYFDNELLVTWYAEGDLSHYNLYLYDEDDTLVNSAMGTTYNSVTLKADTFLKDQVYYLYLEAVPVEGEDGNGEFGLVTIIAEQGTDSENEYGEYTDDEYTDDEYTDDEYTDDEYTDDEYTDDEYTDDEYTDDEYTDDAYTDDEYTEADYSDESYTENSIEELVWDIPLDAMSDVEYIIAYQNKLAEWGWVIVVPEGEYFENDTAMIVVTEGIFDQGTIDATYNLQMYINELAAEDYGVPYVEVIDSTLEYPYVALDLLQLIMDDEADIQIINPYMY